MKARENRYRQESAGKQIPARKRGKTEQESAGKQITGKKARENRARKRGNWQERARKHIALNRPKVRANK